MRIIPQRYGHFAFGIIQSGLTSGIAAGIASASFWGEGTFWAHWLSSWLVSWAVMLPIVVLAAPAIRRAVAALSYEA
jgi:hypothetical protein